MIIISTHAPRMIPSEHLSRQRAGMNGIFDLSLVKNISLGKRFEFFDHEIMKLALIAIGLLACLRQPVSFMRRVLLRDWHEPGKARPHRRAFSFPKFKLRNELDPRPGNSGKLPHRVARRRFRGVDLAEIANVPTT